MKDKTDNHPSGLFDRVVAILEQARNNVVQSVNHDTVLENWLIGREIVLELQNGEERAEYGKQVIDNLSERLTERYGKGFSIVSLKNFRQFYITFSDREVRKSSPVGSQLKYLHGIDPNTRKTNFDSKQLAQYPVGIKSAFSPRLSWSHYRALVRVKDKKARDFYEKEAAECGWDKRSLERQIQTSYYERMLSGQNPQTMICAEKNETVAKYSVLNDRKKIFASKYMTHLPTEEQLVNEIQKELQLIENLQENIEE